MKLITLPRISFFVGLSTIHSLQSTAFAQGSLTPPGAPAPTMKTLAQVEPRTPISSAPFTISSPGAYYLTTNLFAPPFSYAVTIAADNVSLDLHSFTIIGTNTSSGGVLVSANRAVVANGTVRNCPSGYGVNGASADGCLFENLNALTNAVGIYAGSHSIVHNCIASQSSTGGGILCGDGNFVFSNLCNNNGNGGIYLVGSGNRIEGNQVVSNSFYQIVAANTASAHNLIIRNSLNGATPLITGYPANWLIGPLVDSVSIATNNNPNANYNLNQ